MLEISGVTVVQICTNHLAKGEKKTLYTVLKFHRRKGSEGFSGLDNK